jgi:hypothetical protein
VPGRRSTSQPPPGADTALLRWKLGHQLFHLHLAAMNTLLVDARGSLESARWVELTEALDQLRVLYDAATSTMTYAADFSPEMYEQLIRPSMAPPFMSPGFSGVLNTEHDQMTDRLRGLRRRFKELKRTGRVPEAVAEASARLWAAQSRNRRNHLLVCERFVPDGTSLLNDYFRSKETDDSGQENPEERDI